MVAIAPTFNLPQRPLPGSASDLELPKAIRLILPHKPRDAPTPASVKIPLTMATSKSPISCHVLDTIIGRPGASIKVTLTCKSEPNKQFGFIPHVFTGVTNSDGRIAEWENKFGVEVWSIVNEGSDEDETNGTTVWSLKFDTEGYYGEGKTFWPYVELTFRVKKGEHYHVPLLLGPYNYTTYRGS